MNGKRVAALIIVISLISIPVICEEYIGVGSSAKIGAGLRSIGMAGISTALPPWKSALPGNAAGIAFQDSPTLYSAASTRLGVYEAGRIAFLGQRYAAGIDYLSFGGVPITDEFGNIEGAFTFSALTAFASVGMRWSDFSVLARIPSAHLVSTALSLAVVSERYGNFGGGIGGHLDVDILVWEQDLNAFSGLLQECAVGLRVTNLLNASMTYESGHAEDWAMAFETGISVRLGERLLLATELGSSTPYRLGMEWDLSEQLSLRFGASLAESLSLSLGLGFISRRLVLEFAVLPQRDLPWEMRVAFAYQLR